MRFLGIGSIFLVTPLFLLDRLGVITAPILLNALSLLSLSIAAYRLGQITYSKRVGYAALVLTLLFPANLACLVSSSQTLTYAAFCLWAFSFCWKCFSCDGAKLESLLGTGVLFACLLFFEPAFSVMVFPLVIAARAQNTTKTFKLLFPSLFFSISYGAIALLSYLSPSLPLAQIELFPQEVLFISQGSSFMLLLFSLYYALKAWRVGFLHKYDPFFGCAVASLLFTYLLVQEPALLLSSVPLLLIFSIRSYFLNLSRCIRP